MKRYRQRVVKKRKRKTLKRWGHKTVKRWKEVKGENVVCTAPTCFGTARQEAEPEVEVLISAVKKCRYIMDTSFNDFDDEHELKTGSVLTEKKSGNGKSAKTEFVARGDSLALLTTCPQRKFWRML